jgi:hypothetical protein
MAGEGKEDRAVVEKEDRAVVEKEPTVRFRGPLSSDKITFGRIQSL